jgi:hypothetical protein
MTTPEKPARASAWQLIEDCMAEEDVERIARLSPAEVEAELRALGLDPDSLPSGEELLARADQRAKERAAREQKPPRK